MRYRVQYGHSSGANKNQHRLLDQRNRKKNHPRSTNNEYQVVILCVSALLCPALALPCHALDRPDISRRENLRYLFSRSLLLHLLLKRIPKVTRKGSSLVKPARKVSSGLYTQDTEVRYLTFLVGATNRTESNKVRYVYLRYFSTTRNHSPVPPSSRDPNIIHSFPCPS